MLLYEGGEALRFDEGAIRAGVRGVVSVMHALEMLPGKRPPQHRADPFIARSSHWIRAPEAGILRGRVALGASVDAGEQLGVLTDPLGVDEIPVKATHRGVVIGRTELPLVNEGDALFNMATFDSPAAVSESLDEFQDGLDDARNH